MFIQKGEVREVAIEVYSKSNNSFVIDVADYEIITDTGVFVEKGAIAIDGKKLVMLFSVDVIGKYYIVFTYYIGSEKLKAKIKVEVIK